MDLLPPACKLQRKSLVRQSVAGYPRTFNVDTYKQISTCNKFRPIRFKQRCLQITA